MMSENNIINLKAVGIQDAALPLKIEKNPVPEVEENPAPPPAEDRANREKKKEEIFNAIADLERFYNRSIRFEIDQESDEVIVKVIDKESGDVIRQIPSEELVELSKKINEYNLHILDIVA